MPEVIYDSARRVWLHGADAFLHCRITIEPFDPMSSDNTPPLMRIHLSGKGD